MFCAWTHFRPYRGRRVPFPCYALPDLFSTVPRASGPIFLFCTPGLIFGGAGGVGSFFHALRSRTRFRRYLGRRVPFSCFGRPESFSSVLRRRVPFSCFALRDSFSTIPRSSGPVIMFCAPELIFGGTEGVGSCFHDLLSRTRFRRYKGVPSHFNVLHSQIVFGGTVGVRSRFHVLRRPCSISTVKRASGPFSTFFALVHISGGTEGVESRFPSRTRFRRYRGRRVPISCFARPDSFSAVPWASGLDFMFCTRARFRRYGRRRVPFFCFARPDTFSAVPFSFFARPKSFSAVLRASGPVFVLCVPGPVFGGTEGRRVPFSRFALPDSFSAVPRALGPVFTFCASRLVFGGTGGFRSHFLVLRAQTLFRRYRGRPIPFSCFPLPDSFSAVLRASGPVFIFCALGLIFGVDECVRSRFHVLCSRTRFRRNRGRRVPLSCFTRLVSFSAVSGASGPVFTFCAPGLFFGGNEGVRSRFHVLRSRTHFRRYRGRRVPFCAPGFIFGGTRGVRSHFLILRAWTHFRRYRGRQVPFSTFARPDLFTTVPRASRFVFMFSAPRLVFNGTKGVGSHFHVLCVRN
jgi:hypothetical protein